jgi:hypothetical protein
VGVGSGGYRGGGVSVGGIGISLPVGGVTATRGLEANASLVVVSGSKLVWSGSFSAPSSSDPQARVGDLARIVTEAMRTSGVI